MRRSLVIVLGISLAVVACGPGLATDAPDGSGGDAGDAFVACASQCDGAAGDGGVAVEAGSAADAGVAADAGAIADADGGDAAGAPFVDTWGAIHGFLTFDSDVKAAQIPSLSPHADFVWGGDASKVAAWHAANAKTYVAAYIPFDEDPDDQPLSWWQANHPDWVLYKCDQKTPATAQGYPNIDLDVTNPAVQAWQLQRVQAAAAQGYDAIAFDVFAIDNAHAACGIKVNGKWVQRYTGQWSDPQYTSDVLAWMHAMSSAMHALPKPMGLVPNYTLARAVSDPSSQQILADVDAVLDEDMSANWGYVTRDSAWVERVAFIEALQAQGKAYYGISGQNPVTPAFVQWSVATYLMGKQHHAAVFVAGVGQYGADAWRPEYAIPIGHACGAMAPAQGAYARTFEHGLVIANPSSSATVQFVLPAGASFTDLYGSPVSGTATLGVHAGLVLLASGPPSC
jgi:hypothetical protein